MATNVLVLYRIHVIKCVFVFVCVCVCVCFISAGAVAGGTAEVLEAARCGEAEWKCHRSEESPHRPAALLQI